MAALHYLLIALLLSVRVAALQGPKARQIVKTGATAQLHCTSKQKAEVDWFKGTIFDNNLTNLSGNNNYTIDDDTGTLTITKFNRQYHSGPYTCRGQYSDDRILYSCPGTLIYAEPPHSSGGHTVITASLGNTVVLRCVPSYSDPPSFIFWKKNNNVLISTNNIIQAKSGNLYIISVSASDTGYYQCGTFDYTSFITITFSSTYLNITDKPTSPIFIIKPSNTTLEVGRDLEWECASSGSNVTWERLGHASLPPSANIAITGALKFTSVGESDGGVYHCIAGTSSVNVTLTIVAPPTVVLTSNNSSPSPGTSVTFTCSSSSPTLTGEVSVAGVVGEIVYRSSSPVTESFSFTYTIPDHNKEGDIIGVQCLMTNQYGCNQSVINVTIPAARKLTVHVPQETVVGIEGSYVNLTCKFYNNEDISGILWTKSNPLKIYSSAVDQVVGSKTISTLTLGPLNISDSNLYQCGAHTSDYSTVTGHINLTVINKPTTPTPASYDISVTPKEVSLQSGDTTMLTCTLTVQGDVSILSFYWAPTNGIIEKKIKVDNYTTLVQANVSTGGTYTCSAIVTLEGNTKFSSKSVIVTEIPAVTSTPSPSPVHKLTVHVPQETVVAIKGSYVNLTCEFYNYNDGSSIEWVKPSTTEMYDAVTNQVIGSKMVSTITLGPLGISDSDLYQCIAHTSDYSQIVAGSINLSVIEYVSSESNTLIPSSFAAVTVTSQEVSTTTITSEESMIIPTKSVIATEVPAVTSTPSPSPVHEFTVHVPQETVVAIKGSYANLTCEFYNAAAIIWLKLNTFSPYNTVINQVVGSKTISTLTLGPLNISDSNIYECRAYSSDYTETIIGDVNLTVLAAPPPSPSPSPHSPSPPIYPPSPPKYPPRDVTGVWIASSKSIQLSWLPPFDNNTNILGYKLNWGLSEMTLSISALVAVPSSSRGYKIDNLLPNKIYHIIVWAYTIGGDGPHTLIKVQSNVIVPISTTLITMETTSILVPSPSVTPSNSAIIELSSCASVTSTLATVHFKVISSHNINNYTIYYHCLSTGNRGYHNITILERILNVPILLSQLQPGCTYIITAEALSKTGNVIARATPCEVIMPTNNDISKSVNVQVRWSNSNDLVLIWSLSSLLSHLSGNISVEWRIQDISSWKQVNTQQYTVSNAASYQGHLLEVRIKIGSHIIYSKTFTITLPSSLSSSNSTLVLITPTPNAGRQSYHSSPWLTYGVGISSLFCVSMLALLVVLLLKHIQSARREKDKVTDHRHKTNENIYETKETLRHPQNLSNKTYPPSNGHIY